MATIKLRLTELRNLPPICTRCGAAATEVKAESFSWTPQWAQFTIFLGGLPWIFFVLLTRRKATVHLPYCGQHVRYRPLLHKVVWVGGVLTPTLIGLGLYLFQAGYKDVGEWVGMAGMSALGLMVLILMFGNDGGARATLITDATITLEQVSPELADAVGGGFRQGTARGGMELQTAKYFKPR